MIRIIICSPLFQYFVDAGDEVTLHKSNPIFPAKIDFASLSTNITQNTTGQHIQNIMENHERRHVLQAIFS